MSGGSLLIGSYGRGRPNCNDFSIGIELEGLEGAVTFRRALRASRDD